MIVINNEIEIFECAQSFRQDANNLMSELARDNDFLLTKTPSFPKHVYQHKYSNKGTFRNEWTYYFHGAECRFDNLGTGQVVELILLTSPEFGFLDGFFFFNYMQTTERYKKLGKWFGDSINVWDSIEELADKQISR